MEEDVVAIRKKITEFIDGPGGYMKIPYEGPDLNPRRFWHKIVLQSRLRFLWQTAVIFLCTALPSGEFKNRLLRSIGMTSGGKRSSPPWSSSTSSSPASSPSGRGRWSER